MYLVETITGKEYHEREDLHFIKYGIDYGGLNDLTVYLDEQKDNLMEFDSLRKCINYAENEFEYEEDYLWAYDGVVWRHLSFQSEKRDNHKKKPSTLLNRFYRDVDLEMSVSIEELIHIAKNLKSEDNGANPEYDRAMLELITDAARISQNDRTIIANLLGTSDFIRHHK